VTVESIARTAWLAFITIAASLYVLVSCGDAPTQPDRSAESAVAARALPEGNPASLAEWGQLEVSDGWLQLADDVVPYTLKSALFSDYAHKLRTVSLPDGAEPAMYDDQDVFSFPVGTVITKTFFYPLASAGTDGTVRMAKAEPEGVALTSALDLSSVHLVETRVLALREDGWQALPYVWNVDQTKATLQRTGDLQPLTLVNDGREQTFTYVVPDVNQCSSCHATNHSTGEIHPIGPKARHLNTSVDAGDGPVAQLARWQSEGLLGDLPGQPADLPQVAAWNDTTASVNDRARAYLDINCSHCHNEDGAADTSALFLEPWTEPGVALGVCKSPIAAGTGTGGRLVGIQPGAPEDSIFVYRMETLDPGAMMPEVGRALKHTEGVDLVSDWISTLTGTC